MNVDRTLVRSKQGLNILWSLFFLTLAIYLAFYGIKNLKNNKKRKNIKKRLNGIKKRRTEREKISKEETSTRIYPEYSLEEPLLDFAPPDGKESEIVEAELYNYDDLMKVVTNNDNTFFEEYLAAVKECLKYKQQRYEKILEEKYNNRNQNDASNATGLAKSGGNDVCVIIENLLDIISEQLKDVDEKVIKDNFKQMLWHKEKGLESLIERKELKDMIAQQIFGFKNHPKHFFTSHQNGLILGNSGIGKSKIAQCLAYAFSKSHMMVKDSYIITTAERIKSPYIDDTAKVAREFFESHPEEVIIFEEIYSITPEENNAYGDVNRSHGKDALDAIVYYTDYYKGLYRIYGVGYKTPTMERFIKPNEGMNRRFPIVINVKDLSEKGLTKVLIRFLTVNSDIILESKEAAALYGMIIKAKELDELVFDKQSGDMENLSTDIANVIFNTKNGQWVKNDPTKNIQILKQGFNQFLKKKINQTL